MYIHFCTILFQLLVYFYSVKFITRLKAKNQGQNQKSKKKNYLKYFLLIQYAHSFFAILSGNYFIF